MWRSSPRRVSIGVCICRVAVVCMFVHGAVLSRAGAAGSGLAEKRRQAIRISAEIDRVSTQIQVLNEDFLEAQDRLQRANRRMAAASRERTALEGQLTKLRSEVRESALRALAEPDGGGLVALEDSSSLSEFERRRAIERQSGGRAADVNDRLRADQQDLARVGRRLDRARRDASVETAQLKRKRREADALLSRLGRLQASTRGELAELIREEEERAAAAEAAAAQRAIEQRRLAAQRELAAARAAERSRAEAAATDRNRRTARPSVPTGQASAAGAARVRMLAIEAGEAPTIPTSPGAAAAVRIALAQVGKPYVWGAEGPGSYDCSGLMLYAWRASGRRLPHSSRIQYSSTTRVPVSAMRPGDLVFFGRPIHHVGMYVGGGKMVEASRRGRPVRVSSVFRKDMVGVGRVG